MIAVPPAFAAMIKAAKLRHFTAKEILVATDRGTNTLPPKDMWLNIIPSVLVLDELRERVGDPMRITSGYRSPQYNKDVGGTNGSQHKEFRALDFQGTEGCRYDRVWLAKACVKALKQMRGKLFEVPGYVIDMPGLNMRNADSLQWWTPLPERPNYSASETSSPFAFRFIGGIGQYPEFTHLDTRGKNAFWTGG